MENEEIKNNEKPEEASVPAETFVEPAKETTEPVVTEEPVQENAEPVQVEEPKTEPVQETVEPAKVEKPEPVKEEPVQAEEPKPAPVETPKRVGYTVQEPEQEESFWDRAVPVKYALLLGFMFMMIGMLLMAFITKSEFNNINDRLNQQGEEIARIDEELVDLTETVRHMPEQSESSSGNAFNDWLNEFGNYFFNYDYNYTDPDGDGIYEFYYGKKDNDKESYSKKDDKETEKDAEKDTEKEAEKASDKGYLGIRARDGEGGVVIDSVLPNAKETCPLEKGDAIIKINGDDAKSIEEIQRILETKKVGDKLEVTVIRDGKEVTVDVTLVEEYKEAEIEKRAKTIQNGV